MMTTHDAAITSGGLLPPALLNTITYTADNEPLSAIVLEWLARFRYVIHHTTQPIVIVGCMVKDIDPTRSSRYFRSARTWQKRVEVFDNNKEITRELPEDAGLLVFMKWVSHTQSIPLKNQALKTRRKDGSSRAQTPILINATLKDIKQLISFGYLTPEQLIERIRPKFPHATTTLDTTARALMQLQGNQYVRRLAYPEGTGRTQAQPYSEVETSMTHESPATRKQRTRRGALKAFMARHPTPDEMNTAEWKAAKTDEAKGAFLLPIAHAEGIPTTIGSVVNEVRELRKAAARAVAADEARRAAATGLPLDAPPPPPPPPSPPPVVPPVVPPNDQPSHPTVARAQSAIQQGFEALAKARELHKLAGEQLEYAELALQDAQRYTGPDLIRDMQHGLQGALSEAMKAQFGQFLPWGTPQ
jgi:hypothetical protein